MQRCSALTFRPWHAALVMASVLLATSSHAGRPLTTDDAGTVPPGTWEFEAGVMFHKDGAVRDYEFPLGVTTGLLPTLELGAGFGGRIQERTEAAGGSSIHGLGDFAAGIKWNPISEEDSFAAHALAASVKLPTASRNKGFGTGETDFDLLYIGSRTLSDRWSCHLNLGYTWMGDPPGAPLDDLINTGIALSWRATTELEWVTEIISVTPDAQWDDSSLQWLGGVRWHLRPTLMLDAAVGAKLRGEAPDLDVLVGLTWTWDRSDANSR